jgi:hypothetical protein
MMACTKFLRTALSRAAFGRRRARSERLIFYLVIHCTWGSLCLLALLDAVKQPPESSQVAFTD